MSGGRSAKFRLACDGIRVTSELNDFVGGREGTGAGGNGLGDSDVIVRGPLGVSWLGAGVRFAFVLLGPAACFSDA